MAEDSSKKILQLKRTRASMKAKLTQFQVYLNTAQSYDHLSDLHASELECRLGVIEKVYSDFDTLQMELEMMSDPPDEQYDERALFENQYFSMLAGARQLLAARVDKDRSVGSVTDAMVKVYDNMGNIHTARILLDNGSTANFVTQDLCDRLGLMTRSTNSKVSGICNQASISSQSCVLTIQSLYNDYKINLHCLTLQEITKALPSRYINVDHIKIPTDINLADPSYNVPSKINILVGAETFWSIIGNKSIDLGENQPKLYETKLGWLVSGHVSIPNRRQHASSHRCHFLNQEENLTRFWELDNISNDHSLTREERACEENFTINTYQESDGRFVVTMPLKGNPDELGDSFTMAKCRFLSLERRFQKDPSYKNMYINFIKEYEELGHMTQNDVTKPSAQSYDTTKNYYIPHHGVIRESNNTTSLRTVFDASATTSSGVSLNQLQMVGPCVQDDLLSLLLRFRQHKIVVSADIEKMYRAINIHPSQRSLQQIIFRYDPSEPLKTYTLNTVTYGMASAPYLATKCLTSLANKTNDEKVKFAISRDFYVDDFLNGGSSQEEVINTCKGVIDTLSSAQFNLRKFQSNCPEVLSGIFETKTNNLKDLSDQSNSKTLGLYWLCNSDQLSFSINVVIHEKITKRHILSCINQIFDPLGLVGPSIIEAKVIMQDLWLLRINWDDEAPEQIKRQWISFASKLSQLNKVKVPRWVLQNNNDYIELHIFTDASDRLYGSCIYVRSINSDGTIYTQLLVSKNRVCPTKSSNMTIPKKELLGALLGARLCAKVQTSLTLPVRCRYWCDSMIVLGWLATPAPTLKQFVRNRVNEVNELTAGSQWNFVPGTVNPADLLTRPGKADIVNDTTWWTGPQFLRSGKESWPTMPKASETKDLPEVQCHTTQHDTNSISTTSSTHPISALIHKHSNFNRLLHAVAYLQRFIFNCRHKHNKIVGDLTQDELQSSHNLILKHAQTEMFPLEHSLLMSGKTLPTKNQSYSWSPFLDPTDKLMRVRGRIDNSPYSYDEKHPILICSKHHLTKLLFRAEHVKLFHAGPLLLLSNIRQRYWPLGGRNLAKHIVHHCLRCVRYRAKTVHPIMGQLPESRTKLEYPFLHSFVDNAGPVLIADRKGRGCKLIKSYLTIFVCSSVKSVHIELTDSLSSHSYLSALLRFIARRGRPLSLTSDNGLNFVGLRNELKKYSALEAEDEVDYG